MRGSVCACLEVHASLPLLLSHCFSPIASFLSRPFLKAEPPQVLVATPDAVLQLVDRRCLSLKAVSVLVVDEVRTCREVRDTTLRAVVDQQQCVGGV